MKNVKITDLKLQSKIETTGIKTLQKFKEKAWQLLILEGTFTRGRALQISIITIDIIIYLNYVDVVVEMWAYGT